ncbi:hypothetical protein Nepgr_018656 [Nepenthes gracilis]|uniref:Uncharacterized protein n=1 Tax=Nepenthes gracilis TaxID=150966 RepID=A0AAD3XUH1_NEPGR|nr:hypothetical protein Nepgr_018656 [Nepenthes gracilis]
MNANLGKGPKKRTVGAKQRYGCKKRQQDDADYDRSKGNLEGNTSPEDKRRKHSCFGGVEREAMLFETLQHMLEALVRKVVKEEVELALTKHLTCFKRSCEIDVFPSEFGRLQLRFLNTLSLPVFTGARIEGEDGSAIKVALIDSLTKEVVTSGPMSFAKVEIVVLEGDFDSDERESWTEEEFRNYIVKEREGKKPLLTGDVYLNLKDGVGFIGDISFADNSSWRRSRRFRLGARVMGNLDGIRLKEAKTEPFIVKDHRGELYKKHYPPKPSDEVWRLEKIGKDGAFHKRLNKERVRSVKDLLIMLHLRPARLRMILGPGMSAKMWEAIVEHAQTCVLDRRVFLYYAAGTQHPRKGVAFNEVGQVMGLISESHYASVDKLSENEKLDARDLVISASQNVVGVISFEDENSLRSAISNASCTSIIGSRRTENSDCSKLLESEKNSLDYMQPNPSSPDIISSFYSFGCMSSSDDYGLQSMEGFDLSFDRHLDLPTRVIDSVICDTESMARAFCDDGHVGFLDTACSIQSLNPMFEPQADFHSIISCFSVPSSGPIARGAQRRWKVIFSVLQWFFLMRIVVLRRARGEMKS